MEAWGTRRNNGRLTLNTSAKQDAPAPTAAVSPPTGTSSSASSSSRLRQLSRPNGGSSTVTLSPAANTPSNTTSSLNNGASKRSEEEQNESSAGAPAGLTQRTSQGTVPISNGIHPLHFTWVFWFMHRSPGSKITNYESSMKKIAAFSSIEDFWAVYSHLRRPDQLPNISDYHLFKQGVRPVWEDQVNINGGKWIVRLKKGIATRLWENLVIAVIGDQFDVGSEICGAVLSIRSSEDILSLWNRSAHEGRINLKIRDTMKRVLNLPPETIMEYKTHNDALKDNSSFRNTEVHK